ncbi:MAG TPA: Ig-like domain-containing protein [Candidatus Binatia bacterium]|nr:Ig-like domain-containing protein [Candidatus Binatia bacterium]
MIVVNTGRPCGYSVYENPAQRKNPGTEGELTVAPKHGKVEIKPPRIQYTPEPGYSGEDSFSAQMWTGGTRVVLLKFNFKVTVQPPG